MDEKFGSDEKDACILRRESLASARFTRLPFVIPAGCCAAAEALVVLAVLAVLSVLADAVASLARTASAREAKTAVGITGALTAGVVVVDRCPEAAA
jgi:hypothetical protein